VESYRFNNIEKILGEKYGEKYFLYRKDFIDPNYSKPFPLQLDIDLIDACNLRCEICHQSYRKRTNIKITKNILQKSISQALEAGLCSVNVGSASEPLLEKDLLFFTLNLCNELKVMDTFVHTNGIFLTEDVSQFFVDSELKHLYISVDAVTSETYKIIRNSKQFDILLENINTFLKIRGDKIFPELRVSMCVSPGNYKEKDAFLDIWKNKADLVEFQDYIQMNGEIKESIKVEGFSFQKTVCMNGIKRGALWPDGEISACCCAWKDVSFGNICEQDFFDIWNSKKALYLRNALKNDASKVPAICKKCIESRLTFD